MNTLHIDTAPTHTDIDWVPFPGGELEGSRTRALCPQCRVRELRAALRKQPVPVGPACFQCYRLAVERDRKLKDAGELDTASDERFQTALPFEPVNTSRLARLKVERTQAQAKAKPAGGYAARQARARIEARHALASVVVGLRHRMAAGQMSAAARRAQMDMATRAAELQLPEAWLPFVAAQ